MKGSSGLDKCKPYVAVILLQVILAGLALFTKAAVAHLEGMKPPIFVVYRQAFATLSVAPFALFLERKMATKLSFMLLCKIFLVSLLITLTFNLFSWGLKYTTASMAAAASNLVPVITFVFALFFRKDDFLRWYQRPVVLDVQGSSLNIPSLNWMENISIKKWHGWAKVLGSIVCVGGAMMYAFVKGPPLNYSHVQSHKHNSGPHVSKGQVINGSLAVLAAFTAWSFWTVMQAVLLKQYPAKLSLITIQSIFSCIQAAIFALSLDRSLSSWKLGWNLDLLSVAYCGIVVTGVSHWLRLWAIQKKGPVFTALFTPLSLIITVLFSVAIWHELIRLGSVIGAILLVVGLYSVLWGKNKEEQQQEILNGRNSESRAGNSDRREENTVECITR